jgi:hypothetical protein
VLANDQSATVLGKVGIDQTTPGTTNAVAPISGQAGVAGGSGVTGATVQRVVLATDVALPAGANAIGKLAANSGVDIGDVDVTSMPTGATAAMVQGTVAHDAADAQNPVPIGGVAVSGSATPTAVSAGDRTRSIYNRHGIPYVLGGHPNLITREYQFAAAAQTDINLAAAAVGANERIYVTRFEAMSQNATSVQVGVRVGFGTASVPAASASGVSGMIAQHPGIAPGSGFVCGTGAGVIAVGGAGEEPRITSDAATGGILRVLISYFLVDEP